MREKIVRTSNYVFASKINLMGSEVVNGYGCKPITLDKNKPIMHYKTIIYLCDDKRCRKAGGMDKAKELREVLKQMGLGKTKNRIKISRNMCQGACRFRQVMQINENTKANGYEPNNSIWLKHTHKFDKTRIKELFIALSTNQSLDDFEQIIMKVY
jgi:cobalt-precorrin 5A hydrolase